MNILIVEDESALAGALEHILRKAHGGSHWAGEAVCGRCLP